MCLHSPKDGPCLRHYVPIRQSAVYGMHPSGGLRLARDRAFPLCSLSASCLRVIEGPRPNGLRITNAAASTSPEEHLEIDASR